MAKMKPKGRRVEVEQDDNVIYSEECSTQLGQPSGRRLHYGFRDNLYTPVTDLRVSDLSELAKLRAQIGRYGLPVGWECELEVPYGSLLEDMHYNERLPEYNLVVAKANRSIREYLSAQSEAKGWRTFRYAPMLMHKPDGSLEDGGREFVFSPMTPDFAKATGAYNVFTSTLPTYRWQGHDGPNTGGHMHLPIGVFSDQQLVLFYKLVEFLADARLYVEDHPNPERAARFIQMIGARRLGGWARWRRLDTVENYHGIIVEDGRRMSQSRFYIVERSRHNTIELRFPKGTYNAERAIMRSQFINAMWSFTYDVEQASYLSRDAVYDIWDIDKFLLHINQDQRWPELKRYIRRNYNGLGCVTNRNKNQSVKDDVEAYNQLFVAESEQALERIR
jgi:hypothetical protein